jgi:hypothetical protein
LTTSASHARAAPLAILLSMAASGTIRTLTRSDLDPMLDWAAEEGWNPGLHDADAFFATDPDGFLGLDVDGRLAVTLSVVRYDERFGFVGFYICRPELRGRGFGLELFEAGLARSTVTTLGLDGVLEQEPSYARDGFVTAHHSIRFGGVAEPPDIPADGVWALAPADVDAVLAFERAQQVFPAGRRAFLERWLGAPGTIARAIGPPGQIEGYGVVRACREGHKVGPLFCTGRDAAARLLAALLASVGDGEVFLDVPVPNSDGMALARELGLEPVFETARMYRGPAPELRLDRVFGVTTFELG